MIRNDLEAVRGDGSITVSWNALCFERLKKGSVNLEPKAVGKFCLPPDYFECVRFRSLLMR
jgi:hypothetical protein